MLKRIFNKLIMTLFLINTAVCSANVGSLFSVAASGASLNKDVNFTLCLSVNGQKPLSCQQFSTSKAILSIRTTIPHQTYQYAGIKINTPDYTYTSSKVTKNIIASGFKFLGEVSDSQPVIGLISESPLLSISVSPENTSIPKEITQQYIATGTYADGSTTDLTTVVTWESSNTLIATINNEGLATTISAGTTSITASFAGLSGSATLTVTTAILTGIAVSPSNGGTTPGGTLQFTATGNYSDGTTVDLTTMVIWLSTDTSIATISNTNPVKGLATGISSGTTSIIATYGTMTSLANLSVS